MAHASFSKSYYCTVLPTIAFHFLPYTMRSTLTRSSHGFDRQSGRGSLPHLASLPIPSLGAGRPAVLLAPSTTLATTTMRRCGAPACLHHAYARWLRAANRWRPPREQWATPQGSARGETKAIVDIDLDELPALDPSHREYHHRQTDRIKLAAQVQVNKYHGTGTMVAYTVQIYRYRCRRELGFAAERRYLHR